ncbi:TetR/AcrR family transcriptional regulator [Corynebacterium senegalense]|uniref:TetR/AcrR family transcriptional regulator n=1 Tax=Corynebacterium senegalense TaxID=2080750 RepID=UPI000E2029CD|nr:TetR/AcrR family transcriptional regulator [Corynebacterium senegalense]
MTHPLTPRQRELFNALLTDFLAEGFESFTIDAAAKRYRCSKSTIYALGRTRDAIIRRVLVSYFREIARRTAIQDRPGLTAAAALETYFSAMTSALAPASPAFMRDLAAEPVAQEVYSVNTAAATENVRALLERGVASGEFSAGSTAFLSRLIYHTMRDIQRGEYAGTIAPADAYRELGQLLLRGISRTPM